MNTILYVRLCLCLPNFEMRIILQDDKADSAICTKMRLANYSKQCSVKRIFLQVILCSSIITKYWLTRHFKNPLLLLAAKCLAFAKAKKI